MKAYIQFADGFEIPLEVRQPDPPDGTYTLFYPIQEMPLTIDDSGDVWIRVVPEE